MCIRDSPSAVIGLLVVFCLKDAVFTSWHGLPELLGILAVALLHRWKKNILLSIAGGTIFYMVLVQTVSYTHLGVIMIVLAISITGVWCISLLRRILALLEQNQNMNDEAGQASEKQSAQAE